MRYVSHVYSSLAQLTLPSSQIDVSYNVAVPSEEPAFSIDIRLGRQRPGPRNKTRRAPPQSPTSGGMDDFRVTIEICTRYTI